MGVVSLCKQLYHSNSVFSKIIYRKTLNQLLCDKKEVLQFASDPGFRSSEIKYVKGIRICQISLM